ncbi:transcription factor A, mitochondrial [Colletes gigas]|uniref:transcription factor A, mitochondrial n=1 Tax=Colletes gigas TaxID=935657 RepID=UPI001C9BB67C|nr:transcription factor A, mitochondrial [Colletes gigas]
MARFGRLIHSIEIGNFLSTRNYLLSCNRNLSKNVLKCSQEDTIPIKPKKPESPFLLYIRSIKPKFMGKDDTVPYKEFLPVAAKEWANLNPNEKEFFKRQYKTNYEIYVQELKEYEHSLTTEQKQLLVNQKIKEKNHKTKLENKQKQETFGKPKRPLNAFMLYIASRKHEKTSDITYTQWVSLLTKHWHNMTDVEKESYFIEAKQLKTKHIEDLQNWESDMLDLGHTDIVRRKTLGTNALKKKQK